MLGGTGASLPGARERSEAQLQVVGSCGSCVIRSSAPGGIVLCSSTSLRQRDGYLDGVLTGEARVAEPGAERAGGLVHAVEAEVGEAVGAEVLPYLVDGELRGQQLAPVARVDAVEARPLDGRRRDAQMHLGRAGLAQHLHELSLRGAAHDGVVDHDDALAGDVLAQRVELHAHRRLAHRLAGGDEAAADVAVLHQALAVRDAAHPSEAFSRRNPRLRYAHHHVGFDGCLHGELFAHTHPGLMDVVAVEHAVGPGEVDELEQAQGRLDGRLGERMRRPAPGRVDHDHLARVELSHEVRAHDVERGGLGGEHPTLFELAETQRPEAVRIADADHSTLVGQHERERTFEQRKHLAQRTLERAIVAVLVSRAHDRLGEQLRDEIAVARRGARQHAGLLGQRRGVDEIAVVAEHELIGLVCGLTDAAVDRLRVAPLARAGGGVARVADREVADERGERAVVEHRGHEALLLHDHDLAAVADGHTRGLLPPVLEGEHPEVGELRHGLARGVDAEDAARLFQACRRRHGRGALAARRGSRTHDRDRGPRPGCTVVTRRRPQSGTTRRITKLDRLTARQASCRCVLVCLPSVTPRTGSWCETGNTT